MGVEAVQGVSRGCGTRTSGGVYLECGTGYGGRPLEFFLADPPIPLTCDTKLGVQLIERDGVVHVLDWIGEQHYPNCADFLEEGRRLGFSRRISKTLDLSRLSAESRILIVHAKGLVVNYQALRPFMPEPFHTACSAQGKHPRAYEHHCGYLERTGRPDHYRPEAYTHACTRNLWALPPASRVDDGAPPHYLREFASVSYEVFPLAPDAPVPETTSALVASLPITNISIVKAQDGSHTGTLSKVREMLACEGSHRTL